MDIVLAPMMMNVPGNYDQYFHVITAMFAMFLYLKDRGTAIPARHRYSFWPMIDWAILASKSLSALSPYSSVG